MDTRLGFMHTMKRLGVILKTSSPDCIVDVKPLFDFFRDGNVLTGIVRILIKTRSKSFLLEDLAVSELIQDNDVTGAENSILESVGEFVSDYINDGTYTSIWKSIDIEGECWKEQN